MFTVYDKFGDEEICASHTWIATTLCDFCDQVLTRFASPVIEDGLDFIHALYNDAEREAQICLNNIPYPVHVKADKQYNDVDKKIVPKIIKSKSPCIEHSDLVAKEYKSKNSFLCLYSSVTGSCVIFLYAYVTM